MRVSECLHEAPVTVPPECTLEEAGHLMGIHGVGSLIVMRGDQVAGIVTDRDIAVRGVGTGRAVAARVNEVMSKDLVTIQGSADIFDAYRLLKDAGVRRIPVLEDSDLGGIITVDDLLMALVLELGAVVSPIAKEILDPAVPDR